MKLLRVDMMAPPGKNHLVYPDMRMLYHEDGRSEAVAEKSDGPNYAGALAILNRVCRTHGLKLKAATIDKWQNETQGECTAHLFYLDTE